MRRLVALSAALLAAGCSVVTDPDKLDPYQDLASFCPVLYDRLLARFDSCDPRSPAYTEALYASALAACDRLVASERAGRVAYDEAQARRCIDELAGPSCRDFGAACDTVIAPQVAAGGTCSLDVDCRAPAGGCYSPDLVCPGTCMAPGGTGAACGPFDPPCSPAHRCDASASPPICLALPDLGQACSGLSCRPGAYCLSLVCQPQGAVGASCTGNQECDSRLDLLCDAGRCALPPTVGGTAGAACGFPRFCADAFYCDFSAAAPLCRARIQLGAACTQGSQCLPPASCLPTEASGGTASACQVPGREGARCLVGAQGCAIGLSCAGSAAGAVGSCQPWPGIGGTCGQVKGERIECLQGWCSVPTAAVVGACQAIKPLGAPCSDDRQCAANGFLESARCVDKGAGFTCTDTCR